MPTYSYRCPGCGHEYREFQKITDRSRARCPQCGTPGERLITGGGGLHFKGSGFYVTDYKRAGDKQDEKGAGKETKEKKEPGKAESKELTRSTGAES
ncbi:MAG: FmdB family zinc ribbon protein [Gemmatimonadales bacterium]